MKKKLIYRLFISLSLIGFLTIANSCTKEEKVDTSIHQEMVKVSDLKLDFDISRSSFEGVSDDTKAVKKDWEAGDKIHIIFKGEGQTTYSTTGFLTLSFVGSKWNSSATPTDFSIPAKGTMSAIHVFKGRVPYLDGLYGFIDVGCDYSTYFLKDENKNYTVSDGVISEKLEMKLYNGSIQVTITNLKKEDGWNLYNGNVMSTPGGYISCSDGLAGHSANNYHRSLLGIENIDGLAFYSSNINNSTVGNLRLINIEGEVYNKKIDTKVFNYKKSYKITGPKSKTVLNSWTFDSFKKDGVFYDFIDDSNVQVSFNPQRETGGDGSDHKDSYGEIINIPATVKYDGKTYNVTKIGDWALAVQENVKSINIVNGVTEIGAFAFIDCPKLETISLPASISSINYENEVFAVCPNLRVTIAAENPKFGTHPDGSIYDKTLDQTLYWVPEKLIGNLTIKNNCKIIKNHATKNMKVSSINIPASVNKIMANNFNNMSNLTNITLSWNATQLSALGYETKNSGGANIDNFYFQGTPTSSITISVPKGTKAAYKAHPLWGKGNFFKDEQIVERTE